MTMIKVENLSFKYEHYILKNLSFDVQEGKFISLLGVNGAGKSTLLKNLNKMLKPSGGSILIKNKNLDKIKHRDLSKEMSYVSQYNTPGFNTVFDTILIGRCPHIENNICEKDYSKVSKIIEKMDLEKYSLRNTDTLSGGEFQKVVLARALAQEPKILLLDEPTSNLDLKNQIEVLQAVKNYCKEEKISVIVSIHDINLSLKFSDKFILLSKGEILEYGDSSVINSQNIKAVYGVNVDVLQYKERKIIVT